MDAYSGDLEQEQETLEETEMVTHVTIQEVHHQGLVG
jgi:hypothetical protein